VNVLVAGRTDENTMDGFIVSSGEQTKCQLIQYPALSLKPSVADRLQR
jgi:hypothetical protein